jgi:hypothetical protein
MRSMVEGRPMARLCRPDAPEGTARLPAAVAGAFSDLPAAAVGKCPNLSAVMAGPDPAMTGQGRRHAT